MYLGRRIETTRAKDSHEVYATAVAPVTAKVKRSKSSAKVTHVTPAVTVVEKTVIQTVTDPKQERELQRLRQENAVYRGRIHKLLDALRGKNRTIARQEREILALGQSDPLTVDQIMGAKATADAK